jgi:oligo-1,6-glucosidase
MRKLADGEAAIPKPVVAPETPWQPAQQFFTNGPRLNEFLRELRKETFS